MGRDLIGGRRLEADDASSQEIQALTGYGRGAGCHHLVWLEILQSEERRALGANLNLLIVRELNIAINPDERLYERDAVLGRGLGVECFPTKRQRFSPTTQVKDGLTKPSRPIR